MVTIEKVQDTTGTQQYKFKEVRKAFLYFKRRLKHEPYQQIMKDMPDNKPDAKP